MRKAILPIACMILVGCLLLYPTRKSSAATASHLVISEVQVAGTSANDEFVEFYNPTDSAINIDGWRLRKETAGGTQSNLVASLSGNVQPHGYFLVTNPSYSGSVAGDMQYSATSSGIATDNSVLVFSDAGVTLVDQVSMGTATASGATVANPPTSGSVERKANSTSTTETMSVSGVDEFQGNGEDTNNHAADFVVRTISNPQNSASAIEPVPTPTPSATPTLAPTETPTPTATPVPTDTVVPTSTPTSTQIVTPVTTPTVTPTPSPMPRLSVSCSVTTKTITTHFFTLRIPIVKCSVVRV